MRFTLQHFYIWLLYGLFLFAIFLLFTDYTTAFINVAVTLFIQIGIYYINLYLIISSFYEKKRYFYYIFINILLIIVSFFVSEIAEELNEMFIEVIESEHYENYNPKALISHTIPSLLSIFASFFTYSYYKQNQEEKKKLAILSAEKNFLIQQINPHFLFNTLNNIYSLSLDHDPKGPEAIMQLSKMLDYSLYGGRKGKVTLQNEIKYIQHFIDLFKLKDEDIQNIKFDYSEADVNKQIAPMLLVPFIENAFKHGNIESSQENSFIKITLKTCDDYCIFNCVNTYSIRKSVDHIGGIGVQNVSRRLELLYPKKHNLKIEQNEKEYSVSLKIALNENT
ncbi:histidine kinase [Flavobacteriaceae bacterium UJ101]|nr:histidine kinase [Flavobacteriaceae bacterium UJ101]